MKSPLLRHSALLLLSVLVLFGSGLWVGRLTAPRPAVASAPLMEAGPEQRALEARRRLTAELSLTPAQQERLASELAATGTALFDDQERGLFQMHLRLLKLHDTMTTMTEWQPAQLKQLKKSRGQLRDLIISRFPAMIKNEAVLAGEPPERP